MLYAGKEGNSIFKRGNLRYKPDMKLPTVYILHGGGDDDSLLYRYTRLEYYAEQNQVMTVTAQAHDSFFIDTAYGIPYYTFFFRGASGGGAITVCIFCAKRRQFFDRYGNGGMRL